jgi:hypothetical protein
MTNEAQMTGEADRPANSGKCPKCESITYHVLVERLHMREGEKAEWPGVSFVCQICHTILGVSLDPVALRDDVARKVAETIKSR